MIESYTNTSQTIAPEGLLSFATNDVLTGCTVLHSAGSTSFTLKRPGFFTMFLLQVLVLLLAQPLAQLL